VQQLHAVVLRRREALGGQLLIFAEGLQPFPLLVYLLVPMCLVRQEGVESHSVDLAVTGIVVNSSTQANYSVWLDWGIVRYEGNSKLSCG